MERAIDRQRLTRDAHAMSGDHDSWTDPERALVAWGINVDFVTDLPAIASQLHRAAAPQPSEGEADEIAERVAELLELALASRENPDASTAVKSPSRQARLKTTAYNLGIGVAGSGAWELLVWLSHHVPLFAAEDDQRQREQERRRAVIRAYLEAPVMSWAAQFLNTHVMTTRVEVGRPLMDSLMREFARDPALADVAADLRSMYDESTNQPSYGGILVRSALDDLVLRATLASGDRILELVEPPAQNTVRDAPAI
jgi:hypothetical protein